MSTIDINKPITPIDQSIITSNKTTDSVEKPLNQNLKNYPNPLDLQKNFLTLLIAQIQNQDPTDPIKNTEFTSQLALINTASGIIQLNNNVTQFANHIHQNQNLQLSSLIGHNVMIPSDEINHTENIQTNFGIELIDQADFIEIKILDKNKKVLYHNIIKENKEPGIYSFSWNGMDFDHNFVKSGKYYITVTAKNQEKNVPVNSLSEFKVHSIITSPSDDPLIDLEPSGQAKLSSVRKILTYK